MGLPSGRLANPLSLPSPTVNPGAEFGMGGGVSTAAQPTPFDTSTPTLTPTVTGPAPLTQGEIDALRTRITNQDQPRGPMFPEISPFGGGDGW